MRKIAFYTLGCKVNQADTASMEEIFRKAGYEIVQFNQKADVYLINTCVVTNNGQRRSRQIINRAVRNHPLSLTVVTGCYPQTAPEEVKAIEGVDVIIGNQERGHSGQLSASGGDQGQKGPSYGRWPLSTSSGQDVSLSEE